MPEYEEIMGDIFGAPWVKEKPERKIRMKGIPFMISENGEIVCIPDTGDQPVIGVFGRRGTGKSYSMHGIVDRAYWYLNKRLCIINDILDETFFWSRPNDDASQIFLLNRLNEFPKPLPAVYLYPSTDTLVSPKRQFYLTSLPWREIVWNDKEYLNLGKSAPYFRRFKRDFCSQNFKTWEEVDEYLQVQDLNENTFNKISAVFQDLWDSRVTDMNTDSITKVEVGFGGDYNIELGTNKYLFNKTDRKPVEFYPMNGFMATNLIPVLITSDIVDHQEIYPNFMRFHLQNIFRSQTENSFFKNNSIPVWAVCDEITTIAATDINTKAGKMLTKYATAGRPVRIGLLYATQNYTKVPKRIRSNTTYCICLSTLEEEANAIRKDFELEKYMQAEIINLGKYEIYALTKEKFLVYPTTGEPPYFTSKPIKGRSLPPLSKHKPPSKNQV